MKRIIPAGIILIFMISVCFISHHFVEKHCNQTLQNLSKYKNKEITYTELNEKWKEDKEKMSLFANHSFLDEISIYIGQLKAYESKPQAPQFEATMQRVESLLLIIKEEQQLRLYSFY